MPSEWQVWTWNWNDDPDRLLGVHTFEETPKPRQTFVFDNDEVEICVVNIDKCRVHVRVNYRE